MLTLKDGVRLGGLVPQMVLAARIIEARYDRLGVECVITSGNDSTHSGKPVAGDAVDPHYAGKALDVRIQTVPVDQREGLVTTIQAALGSEFVVLHEGAGTSNEHLHVQYGRIAP